MKLQEIFLISLIIIIIRHIALYPPNKPCRWGNAYFLWGFIIFVLSFYYMWKEFRNSHDMYSYILLSMAIAFVFVFLRYCYRQIPYKNEKTSNLNSYHWLHVTAFFIGTFMLLWIMEKNKKNINKILYKINE